MTEAKQTEVKLCVCGHGLDIHGIDYGMCKATFCPCNGYQKASRDDKMNTKTMSKLNIIDTPCPFYNNDGVICNSVEPYNPWWNKVNYVCYCPNHPQVKK